MDSRTKVFISHSSTDTWVALQIAEHIRKCGADTFLDAADIDHGDDFEQEILRAANESSELLVLLTPWSIERRYIWLEIGVFWGAQKRMVGVLYGLDAKALATDEKTPVMLKRLDLVELNKVDSYFGQLTARIKPPTHV